MKFDIAIAAIKGARRYQEDTALFAVDEDGCALAVLADGMGGHAGGAEASRIACETFLASCKNGAETKTSARLLRALDDANRAIASVTDELPQYTGMGCTLVGAAFDANGLTWVSVGDSLLYLWRRNSLAVLNDDHSLAPEIDRLAEAGVISWEEAMTDPRRHYLRSAVTGTNSIWSTAHRNRSRSGRGYSLLASDGLDTLDSDAIAAIIADAAAGPASTIAETLLSGVAGAAHAGQDNATVVAVRVVA